MYHELPWFELELKYNGTEAGRQGSVVLLFKLYIVIVFFYFGIFAGNISKTSKKAKRADKKACGFFP